MTEDSEGMKGRGGAEAQRYYAVWCVWGTMTSLVSLEHGDRGEE